GAGRSDVDPGDDGSRTADEVAAGGVGNGGDGGRGGIRVIRPSPGELGDLTHGGGGGGGGAGRLRVNALACAPLTSPFPVITGVATSTPGACLPR
ncbi:MAG: hypothetical protein KC933_39750, partial [Myxococcales bacterium]|nr:hypothetical protein [Myxococcales bacterium]